MSDRREKAEKSLERSLSELIPNLKDPRIPMVVTVERVRLNPDFSQARVLVSALAGEEELSELEDALNRASGYLQRELAKELQGRKTPKLSFTTDPGVVL